MSYNSRFKKIDTHFSSLVYNNGLEFENSTILHSRRLRAISSSGRASDS